MAACIYDICDGSGFVYDEPTNTSSDCRCRAQTIARNRARDLSAIVPPRYLKHSFDRSPVKDIEPRFTVDAAARFANRIGENLDAGNGLFFIGPVGTGKTELAMQITMAALEAGRTAARFTAPRLFSRIRESFGDGTYQSLFEGLVAVDLLHIDDLGAEQSTPWVLEELYSIVNTRYEEERSLIVTTNIYDDPDELKTRLTERTLSRILHMCDELKTEGHDHRLDFAPDEPSHVH